MRSGTDGVHPILAKARSISVLRTSHKDCSQEKKARDYVELTKTGKNPQRLDASTQGEYTKPKPASKNVKDFNASKAQSQILPLRRLGSARSLKGFVKSLKLRKNTKKALLSLISAGRFEYRALA